MYLVLTTSERLSAPFKVTCTGPCEWNRTSVPGLPGGDTITIDRAWSEITGRDAAGGPGKIQFDGQGYFKGRLGGVDDDGGAVLIDADDGRRHAVPLGIITRANLEVEF